MCRSDGALILNSYALLQRYRSGGALVLLIFNGIAQFIQMGLIYIVEVRCYS